MTQGKYQYSLSYFKRFKITSEWLSDDSHHFQYLLSIQWTPLTTSHQLDFEFAYYPCFFTQTNNINSCTSTKIAFIINLVMTGALVAVAETTPRAALSEEITHQITSYGKSSLQNQFPYYSDDAQVTNFNSHSYCSF